MKSNTYYKLLLILFLLVVGLVFSMPAFAAQNNPGDSCKKGKKNGQYDCTLKCRTQTWIDDRVGNGTCDTKLQCAAFGDDGGDCVWNPGDSCGGNKQYTCDGQCKKDKWINKRMNNGVCDQALDCDAFAYDNGKCGVDCYSDYDGDGYGDMYGTSTHVSGGCPAGSVQDNTDCNDTDSGINPDATETCNFIDDNCNSEIDEGLGYHYYWDYDGDGYGDANDNGFDYCYYSLAQMTSWGYVLQGGDCAPANPAVHPGAAEICGDGIDNDCDPGTPETGSTVFYKDNDGDGYGAGTGTAPLCSAPAGYVADNSDCDDGNAAVNPGATEVCNGVDDNCDTQVDEGLLTTYYADVDVDGYGDPASSVDACSLPAGYVADNTDCDDTDPTSHPGGEEICDHADNNCDTQVDEGLPTNTYYADADGDGFGDPADSVENCDQPVNYVTDSTDCNDNDADVHPGAFDVCGNGVDENCNGTDRVCGTTDSVCANLADIPLETQVESAPPLVMFLVDDSGSMNWDVLCPESNGRFSGNSYYSNVKKYWKSQFSGYNGVYYDPALIYSPWPDSTSTTYDDASKDSPKTDPNGTNTKTLNNDFYTSVSGVHIKWSHYYVWSATDQVPYLVNITGSGGSYAVSYYVVGCNGDCRNDYSYINNLTLDSTPPADVFTSRTAAQERQNFANWYQYYRKRQLTAISALSNVVTAVNGMKIGIHAINKNNSVDMIAPRSVSDYRGDILDSLYAVGASGSTPLRNGLKDVGNYYDDDTNGPFSDTANGGQCQQAFTIMMTDGYYNGSSPSVGNADGDDTTDYDGSPFGDTYSNTLADVAMKYYENDLNVLSNNVPHNAADPAPHQHMVTYSVSFGLNGSLDPAAYNCPAKTCPTWPYIDTNDEHIDDLWHAAVNGRGKYLSAKNSQQLAYALSSILKDVSARAGVGASVAVNTRKLQENTMIYQGSYNSAGWTGDLKAYSVSASDGSISDTPVWSAAQKLDNLADPVSSRNIYTMGANGGVAFTTANINSLTSAEKQSLGSDNASRLVMIDYLRGDISGDRNHGGTMRVRITLLGDIIHSAPVHVGDYIYVGGNDGMLHAFDATAGATGGQEIFAYIPSFVYENLAEIANPDYAHKYFIDNTPFVGHGDSGSILLISGLGKGGKGYFCLDVTSPATFSASNVKWEYPNSSSSASEIANMGYSFSQAAIVPTEANGDVVIFGNGYDSTNAKAVLYVLNKSDGSLIRMIDTEYGDPATNCNGLSTPVFIDPDNNGKANYAYAGDLRGNIWKFDLNGDVSGWHVAFENGAGDPRPLFQARDDNGIPQPITTKLEVQQHCMAGYGGYIVLFGTGKFNSQGDFNSGGAQGVYGIWDWSGAWEKAADDLGITTPVDTTDKYLGAFNNPGAGNLSNVYTTMTDVGDQLTLVEQQAGSGEIINGDMYRSSSANDMTWFNVKRYLELQNGGTGTYGAKDDEGYHLGWYFPLPNSGERVVADPILQMGYVLIVSLQPSSSMCSPGGESFFYALNYCSGSAPDAPIFDINGDGTINSDDTMSSGDVPNSMELNDIYYTPVILVPPNEDSPLDFLVFGPDKTAQMKHQKLGIIFWRFLNID